MCARIGFIGLVKVVVDFPGSFGVDSHLGTQKTHAGDIVLAVRVARAVGIAIFIWKVHGNRRIVLHVQHARGGIVHSVVGSSRLRECPIILRRTIAI